MDTEDKLRAFDVGGIDYVAKPFQFEEVLARVKTHVALRRAQKAAADSYNRLRTMEQLRDDLVHMIVHDLRSPLQSLVNRLTLLQQVAPALDEDAQDDLKVALKSGNEVVRMVNDVLDVSRLEAGQMPVKRAEWDLTRMANDVCVALASMHPGRQIDIESPDAVNVNCDGALVRRIMENLVSNAIKHTPKGTRMRVSIARRDDRVRVAVHDEGSGVPPNKAETIFEKFGTLAGRQDRDYESVGLGLAFCRLAVEAHGGHIGVEPGMPVGSTFWFELPALVTDVENAPTNGLHPARP
jgi:K+-sensing histidine kinase KdpD